MWLKRLTSNLKLLCNAPGQPTTSKYFIIMIMNGELLLHDDKKHFEFIVLDSFQAGLSWKTILHRRKHLQYFFYLFHLKSNELKLA